MAKQLQNNVKVIQGFTSLVPIESDFLLVINSNLRHILHCFWDIAFDRSKIAIFGYPSCVSPTPDGGVLLGRSP